MSKMYNMSNIKINNFINWAYDDVSQIKFDFLPLTMNNNGWPIKAERLTYYGVKVFS